VEAELAFLGPVGEPAGFRGIAGLSYGLGPRGRKTPCGRESRGTLLTRGERETSKGPDDFGFNLRTEGGARTTAPPTHARNKSVFRIFASTVSVQGPLRGCVGPGSQGRAH